MKDELPERLFHNGFISFVDGSILDGWRGRQSM